MRLMKAVDVEDARIKALTPEAFRLVLEARGWDVDGEHKGQPVLVSGHQFVPLSEVATSKRQAIELLGCEHHAGSTFDAFVEVERVQALLEAVEAAERGEWAPDTSGDLYAGSPQQCDEGEPLIEVGACGVVFSKGLGIARLWSGSDEDNPERAAREARAQLPRLVRIICGVEG